MPKYPKGKNERCWNLARSLDTTPQSVIRTRLTVTKVLQWAPRASGTLQNASLLVDRLMCLSLKDSIPGISSLSEVNWEKEPPRSSFQGIPRFIVYPASSSLISFALRRKFGIVPVRKINPCDPDHVASDFQDTTEGTFWRRHPRLELFGLLTRLELRNYIPVPGCRDSFVVSVRVGAHPCTCLGAAILTTPHSRGYGSKISLCIAEHGPMVF